MKFKRQSRGHISHVDSSPQRSADDDDDDDECADEQRRLHGTSTVTSRSGSPAVDSTTTDCCSVSGGDARTPNEPSLPSSQQTPLENDETPTVQCSDKSTRLSDDQVVNVADERATDPPADDANREPDTTPRASVVAAADTVNATPSETQNNLARLEIMTCIAGGDVDHCQNIVGLQSPRPRRGHASAVARPSRPAGSRCDGRRARAAQSRARSIALMAGYGSGACGGNFDVSDYRRASVFNGNSVDRNYISDFRRQSRDIARNLESTLAFPGSTYSDTARCLYTDLTASSLFLSDSYPGNAVTSAFQQQQQQQSFESYAAPADNHFQSSVVGRPSPPALPCHVTTVGTDSDSFKPLPRHSAASFATGETAWQTWKDWRWNDGASFPANAVDYDDDNVLEQVNWRSPVDRRDWTNGASDFTSDVIRTSFPPNQTADATRRSQLAAYWNGGCSTVYPCTSNYGVPYYDVSRAANYCSVTGLPPTAESSRFYDGAECCYAPASSSLSTAAAAADGQELTPCQSGYQSCKYSGVVDSHCRLYPADGAPPFVNTA